VNDEPRRNRRYAVALAAVELFAERGVDATTVDDIASAAGISQRTFFRYFESKEAAAFPDHADRVQALRHWLAARSPARAPLAAALEVSARSASEYFEDPGLYRPRYRLVRSVPALRDHERVADRAYEDAIAEFLASEADGLDGFVDRAVAAAVVAVVNHALEVWAFDESADGQALLRAGLAMIAERFGPIVDHDSATPLAVPPGDLLVVVPSTDPRRRRILDLIGEGATARKRKSSTHRPTTTGVSKRLPSNANVRSE